MKYIYRLLIPAFFLIATALDASAAPRIYGVSEKRPIEYRQFISRLQTADVTFIGETHDDKEQHKNQLEIIRSLHDAGKSIAIGLEMFTTDNQQQLDDWTSGKIKEEDFKGIYTKNWSYGWDLYRDIFIYARDNKIPMIALNVPKAIIAKVVRGGSAALTEEDKSRIPPNVSWNLNAAQTEYLKKIRLQVFGNRPAPSGFSNFAQAQALRNSHMSWSITRFHARSPQSKVIVLTGTLHAIKNGAPEQLNQEGVSSKSVLPQLPEFIIENATTEEADFFILK